MRGSEERGEKEGGVSRKGREGRKENQQKTGVGGRGKADISSSFSFMSSNLATSARNERKREEGKRRRKHQKERKREKRRGRRRRHKTRSWRIR